MNPIEALLKTYQQANEEKRLYLYLSHASLRSRFQEIDYLEYCSRRKSNEQEKPNTAKGGKWMHVCIQKVRMTLWPCLHSGNSRPDPFG